MNIYFLVEGVSTEMKLYPSWLSYLVPELTRVKRFDHVNQNNYFILTGGGYPQLLDKVLPNSIEEINLVQNYDYFVICLDAEDFTVPYRINEVNNAIKKSQKILNSRTNLRIIVQNCCIETWFLGNRKIYSKYAQDPDLLRYMAHYNVAMNDPELMNKPFFFHDNKANFHFSYLRKLFQEKHPHNSYSKNNPKDTVKATYLAQLVKRITSYPAELRSFGTFFALCNEIRSKIIQTASSGQLPSP